MTIGWIQASERMVGRAGLYPDTLNRALRDVLTKSGFDPDAATFPGFAGPVYNIIAYGADPTGAANSFTAVNDAITAASAAGGGTVYVPRGTFKVTDEIVVPSNVCFRGEGSMSIVQATGMAGKRVFVGGSRTNVVFERFAIAGVHGIGISLGACSQVVVRRMDISGGTSPVVANGSYGGAGVHIHECTDVVIEDNYFHGNGYRAAAGSLGADILLNGLDQFGHKRHFVRNNRCTSTDVHSNISAYNLQESEISGNECTGAYTKAADNTGYGILLYLNGALIPWDAVTTFTAGTIVFSGSESYQAVSTNTNQAVTNPTYWTLIDHAVRDNRIVNNHVHDTEGTGIYTANARRTLISGNVVERCATVQTEGTLPASGIGVNGGVATVLGNEVLSSGRSGITLAAIIEAGSIVAANRINGAAGLCGIRFAGNLTSVRIANNDVTGCVTGIGSTDASWTMQDVSVLGNRVVSCSGHGIYLTLPANCTVNGNTVRLAGAHGIWLQLGAGNNTAQGNSVTDASQSVANTYAAIYNQSPRTTVVGNAVGNTAANGSKYGVLVDSGGGTGTIIAGNTAKNNRTADYSLEAAAVVGGNLDTTASAPFPIRQQATLTGAATAVTQLLLGDSSLIGAVGTRWSGGDTYLAHNASHVVGSDSWHQSNAGNASKLLIMRQNGDCEFYSAPAGTADAGFATFWGTAKVTLTATGAIKSGANQVLAARITGWNAPTGTLTRGTFDVATATTASTAQALAALITDLRTHGLINT